MSTSSVRSDYAILSDLHLSEGKRPATRRISRLENFLADRPFEHLLAHLETVAEQKGCPWTLVFNGDMLDFLRVTSIPDPDHPPSGLPHISQTKIKYGLGTSPAESKWQIERVVEGHPGFFQALARFLLAGHRVIIIKGNHDVNWFWPEVRYRFLELLEGFLSDCCPAGESRETEVGQALDRVQIRSWCLYIKDLLYVEHGNQYDPVNAFRNFLYPLFADPDSPVDRYEIDLPLGSFFIRYFFNKVENQNPLAPNYRHSSSYFYSLWRRHFYETWHIVRNYFPYFFRTLSKLQVRRGRRHREMQEHNHRLVDRIGEESGKKKAVKQIAELQEPPFQSKLDFFTQILERPFKKVALALSILVLVSFLWSLISEWIMSSGMNIFFRTTTSLVMNYIFIITGLVLLLVTLKPSKEGTAYSRADPSALRQKAARIAKILNVRHVTFGHSHVEDIWKVPGRDAWYFNTGTWSPLIDEETRTLRPDLQFPVLLVEGDEARLARWNDATGELEDLPIMEDRVPG
jgi:UDP-2,3-diacylglucosamine pyrophosphatase LpxH